MGHDAELFAGGERIGYWRSKRSIHAAFAALSKVELYSGFADAVRVVRDGGGSCEYRVVGGEAMSSVFEAAAEIMRVLDGLGIEEVEHIIGQAMSAAHRSGATEFTYKATW